MNVCMYGKIEAGFGTLKAKIEKDMAGKAGKFCTDWRLADLGNNEIVFIGNITDFNAMGEMMGSPEEIQWDKDNGAVYTAYQMQEITE